MALGRRGGRAALPGPNVLVQPENDSFDAIATEFFSSRSVHRPRLCAAIVDRLTSGGNIIETGTESYRLAHTRQQLQR